MSILLKRRHFVLKGVIQVLFRQLTVVLFLLGGLRVMAQAPIISSIAPASGPVGTVFTATGSNLSALTTLTVGGTAAIVVRNTSSEVVGMVMPGTASGVISITNAGGSGSSSSSFTVIANAGAFLAQSKITGTGTIGASAIYQGTSVALSADGLTALVGGTGDDTNIGAAWVFAFNGTSWVQQTKLTLPPGEVVTGNTYAGQAVALSADGRTAAIGAMNTGGSGRVWVFSYDGVSWSQQAFLGATSAHGFSIALSANGNILVSGSRFTNQARVYERTGTTWGSPQTLQDVSGAATGALQGWAVAVSADGSIVGVGGILYNSQAGAAWVYKKVASVWTQQALLQANDNVGQSWQGNGIAISSNGNTIAVGGGRDASDAGATWIYEWNGSTWVQQGSKLVGTSSTSARQGSSVALSADGNTLAVGGPFDNGTRGATWVFTRSGSVWSAAAERSKLIGPTAYVGTRQGSSVALSSDGRTIFAGGPFDLNGFPGAAFDFRFYDRPVITSFTPTSAGKDTMVALKGKFFTGATQVSFGGVNAQSFVVVNDDSINAVVNTGATGVIQVCNAGSCGTSSSSFTFLPAPTISSLSRLQIGTDSLLTITGTNLGLLANRADKILIGGVAPAEIQSVTATSIRVKIGSGASGPVTIITRGGMATSASSVEFIQPPTITGLSLMPVGPRQNITITGTNLLTANCTAPNCPDPVTADNVKARVKIGGINAFQVSSVTGTQIIAQADSGASGTTVYVRTIGGEFTISGFSLIPKPYISSFTPTAAGARDIPQNYVTIRGTNLGSATIVQFGGVAATITVTSTDSIVARPEPGSASGEVRVFTQGGNYRKAGFTFIQQPTIANVLPNTSLPTPRQFGEDSVVVVTGTNLATFLDATIGGVAPKTVSSDPLKTNNTRITFTVSTGASGPIVINTLGGTATSLQNVTFIPKPTITGISPDSIGPKQSFTITGLNLATTDTLGPVANRLNRVFIGGIGRKAFQISSVSGTQIVAQADTVTSPSNDNSNYGDSIYVTTRGGRFGYKGFKLIAEPRINSFNPTAAGARDTVANYVTILGTNLGTVSQVQFGGVTGIIVSSAGDTIIARPSVGSTSGKVRVFTQGGNTERSGFTFIQPPTIANVLPSTSLPTPRQFGQDSVVVVTGTNLDNFNYATLGGQLPKTVSPNPVLTNATRVTMTVNTGASGPITICTLGGCATSSASITFIPPPTISGISVDSIGPKQSFTITGFNLATTDTLGPVANRLSRVFIGRYGRKAFQVSSVSGTQIVAQADTVTSPSNDNSNYGDSIYVTTRGGRVGYKGFKLIAEPRIFGFSPTAAGARDTVANYVTILGTNLGTVSQVQFGGVTGIIVSSAGDKIIARPAAGSASGKVRVFTQGGNTELSGFTFIQPPTIANVLPNTVLNPRLFGEDSVVVVTGTNLDNFNYATLGGQLPKTVSTNPVLTNATRITFTVNTVNPGRAGPVTVCTLGGCITSSASSTFIPKPTISGITPSLVAPKQNFTISGSNLATVDTGTVAGQLSRVTIGGVDNSGKRLKAFQVVSISNTEIVAQADTFNKASIDLGAAFPDNTIEVTTRGGKVTSNSFNLIPRPYISSFTPASAGARDITQNYVTISGSNLASTTDVQFGGVSGIIIGTPQPNQVIARPAAGTPTGVSEIRVFTQGGNWRKAGFTFIPPPTLTNVLPNTATNPRQFGEDSVIVVTGTNLATFTDILVGGQPRKSVNGNPLLTNDSRLTFIVGTGATGPITVSTYGGTVVSLPSITFIPKPTITGIIPDSIGPRQSFTITGTNLATADTLGPVVDRLNRVFIGRYGRKAFQISSVSGTQIVAQADTVTSSSNANTTYGDSIYVITRGGRVGFKGFRLIPEPRITGFTPGRAGILDVPQNYITITGTNFGVQNGFSRIQMGGVDAFIASWSPTQIVARPLPGSTGSTIRVFTQGGNTSNSTFTIIPPPTITSILPATANPGTMITITGTEFGSSVTTRQYLISVTIGGVPLTVIYDGPTQLRAVLGNYTVGAKSVVMNTFGGSVTYNSVNYSYLTPTISSFTPARRGAGKPVTVTGTRLYNLSDVKFLNTSASGLIATEPTSIVANMPNLGTGYSTGNVQVFNPGGSGTATGSIEYVPPPTITGISITSGRREDVMVITGTNLNEKGKGILVRIGGEIVDSVLASTSNTITLRVGVVQSGSVTVQTEGGISNPSPQTFTFIAPPSITRIYTSNNVPNLAVPTLDVISVEGKNLFGILLMKLGDVTIPTSDLTFLATDGTLLKFIAPATVNGLVRFAITTFGGGPVFSTDIQVQGVTIEEDQNLRNILRVYPVPCVDTLLLAGSFKDIDNPTGTGTIRVRTDLIPTSFPVNISLTSVSGQVVFTRYVPQSRDPIREQFYMADLPRGVYILSVYYGRQVGYWTIIKN